MALPSTIYRFKIALSDVDRSLYETFELRVAMHPSESVPYLLTRIIAYALNYQEGIEFTQGISSPEDPAIWVKDLTGAMILWIEIGNPSARRLHKAAKASQAVRIYTHRDPENLKKEIADEIIHRKDEIGVYSIKAKFLDELAETLERDNSWDLLVDENELAITAKGKSYQTEIGRHSL